MNKWMRQREVSRAVPQGSLTTPSTPRGDSGGAGGRVVTFEDDPRLGAMVRA